MGNIINEGSSVNCISDDCDNICFDETSYYHDLDNEIDTTDKDYWKYGFSGDYEYCDNIDNICDSCIFDKCFRNFICHLLTLNITTIHIYDPYVHSDFLGFISEKPYANDANVKLTISYKDRIYYIMDGVTNMMATFDESIDITQSKFYGKNGYSGGDYFIHLS